MIEEKTPQYIIELKADLIKHFDDKIEEEINELAILTAKEFEAVHTKLRDHDKRFDDMGFEFDSINNQLCTINEKIEKVEGHIGRYEIRSQNLEKK